MNAYETSFSSLFTGGRMVRILPLGDLLSAVTGAISGWRSLVARYRFGAL